jgi:glutamate synthase (NADPH/NADH) small chain
MVVVAIGTRSNPMLTSSEPDLKINEWGYLVVDQDGMTSVPGIFAGGDIVRGAATVILAMGDGKRAARAIERYLGTVAELLPAAQQLALSNAPAEGASGQQAAATA